MAWAAVVVLLTLLAVASPSGGSSLPRSLLEASGHRRLTSLSEVSGEVSGEESSEASALPGDMALCDWDDLYLPDVVQPSRYDLNLTMALSTVSGVGEGDFVTGSVGIRVKVAAATRCVVLHALDMDITHVAYKKAGGQLVPGHVMATLDEVQQVVLMFDEPLALTNNVSDDAQLPQLLLEFNYEVIEGLDGLYISRSVDKVSGAVMSLALTQFQSIAARKALPSFDEPRFKAKFAVTLTSAPLLLVANMPEVSRLVKSDGMVERSFQVSPPMSIYLVAWVYGNMSYVSGDCPTEYAVVPLSIYASDARDPSQLRVAHDVGCAALKRLTSSFGVPYPLPKLDMAAVPIFNAGAMENWGLIIFLEKYLLLDPQSDDVNAKLGIGNTVAHEVVHQWLNEGFGTYFAYLGADEWNPGYGYYQNFFYKDTTTAALLADTPATSHPMSSRDRVTSLTEPDSYFDAIMYQKGAAVLRMLHAYVDLNSATGPSADPRTLPMRHMSRHLLNGTDSHDSWRTSPFLSALRDYLMKHSYQTVTADLLWASLSNSTDPVINAELLAFDPVTTNSSLVASSEDLTAALGACSSFAVVVSQRTVLPDAKCGPVPGADGGRGPWYVPLAYSESQSPAELQWVALDSCQSMMLPIPTTDYASCNSSSINATLPYLLLNSGRFGFYRVAYSLPLVIAIAGSAGSPAGIPAVDMAGMLSDSYRLVNPAAHPDGDNSSSTASLEPFLNLLAVLGERKLPELAPWSSALASLASIRLRLDTAAAYASVVPGVASFSRCVANLDKFVVEQVTGPTIASLQDVGADSAGGLTWDVTGQDSLQLRLMRPLVLQAAGASGDAQQMRAATALMGPALAVVNDAVAAGLPANASALAAAIQAIHPDVLDKAICLTAMSASDATYSALLQMYALAASNTVSSRVLSGLTCVLDPAKIQDLLTRTATPFIKLQDIATTLTGLASRGGMQQRRVWEFLFSNGTTLEGRFATGTATYSLGMRVVKLGTTFPDSSQRAAMQAFAVTAVNMLDPSFLDQYEEATASNAAWLAAISPGICSWLEERV
ncbi:hypothetical protein QJQ45_010113 [Haematococcus lacustris]|nr:hypothetical protein QJQ45_010113 [Haematococcus lacustris]